MTNWRAIVSKPSSADGTKICKYIYTVQVAIYIFLISFTTMSDHSSIYVVTDTTLAMLVGAKRH